MAVTRTVSISEAQDLFPKNHKLKPSQVFQSKIEELMVNLDDLAAFKKNGQKETIWQRMLRDEPNFKKRKMLVFEFLDQVGIDTSDWEERIALENG